MGTVTFYLDASGMTGPTVELFAECGRCGRIFGPILATVNAADRIAQMTIPDVVVEHGAACGGAFTFRETEEAARMTRPKIVVYALCILALLLATWQHHIPTMVLVAAMILVTALAGDKS